MDQPAEAKPQELSRKELLDAIDFEISQRESWLTRHGISTWTIAAASLALLWTLAMEISGKGVPPPNWTHVLLVAVAAHVGLGVLSSPWYEALGWGIPSPNNRKYTMREQTVRYGLDPNALGGLILWDAAIIAGGIYLAFHGFPLFGILTSLLYAVALLVLLFVWIGCSFKVPVKLPDTRKGSRRAFRYKMLFKILFAAFLIVPLRAMLSAWPTLERQDLRLGLMIAGVAFLWGISLTLLRPPTTNNRLRELRSQLAFGNIDVEAARREAEWALHGAPQEQYVMAKAEEITSELNDYIQRYSSLVDGVEQIAVLADKLRQAPPDGAQSMVSEAATEFRAFFRNVESETKALEVKMGDFVKLRSDLALRIHAAKFMLNLKPEFLKEVAERVDTLGRTAVKARQEFADKLSHSKENIDYICERQRDVILPEPTLKKADIFAVFFKE